MVKDGDSSTLNWPSYVTFYTIVTNYNEPLAAVQAHIHVATHIDDRAMVALRSIGLRQVANDTVASPLQVWFA